MLDLSPFDLNAAHAVPYPVPDSKVAISVVGLGYVGAVSCACLSSLGHRVMGVDIDPRKVADIAAGRAPIHEKDLGQLLSDGVASNLVFATDDLAFAVRDTDVTFVSVGTPTAPDGGCDYRYIEAAARSMAVGLAQKSGFHVFAMRCSIPPGTTMKVMTPILERLSGKVLGRDFGVAFNPEFLREGVAIADFFAPPKTVIGTTCDRTAGIMRQIYAPVDGAPLMTSIETAEMVKYVDNVWHATKVCFANEVGRLAKSQGVDSHEVMEVFCQDTKLNLSPYYLKPGFAYGGSCLPKEVRAVAHIAKGAGVSLPLIEHLGTSNDEQIAQAVRMIAATGARRVCILGLAFKPGTDDLRESPILEVIAALREAGVSVTAHDPAVTRRTDIEGQLA
jgi:GDP-mannose 6-dehydrogenase